MLGSNLAHHFATLPTACGASNNPSQNSEGSRILRNDVHHVMLKLIDGGGIYTVGSHIASASVPAATMAGNHLHDIVLNPYMNQDAASVAFTNNLTCKGLYFDEGSDGWLVRGNYAAKTQGLYFFHCGARPNAAQTFCVFSPSVFRCSNGQNGAAAWWAPAWPHAWTTTQCGTTYTIPGQTWSTTVPNYWLDITHLPGVPPSGPYDAYDRCDGYAAHADFSANGGMIILTGTGLENRLIYNPSSPGQPVLDIILAAGPYDNVSIPGWYYVTTDQIHRRPVCGGPVTPESQIQ